MAENCFFWSTTASSNDAADAAVPWAEGMLPGAVNNGARGIMAGIARLIKDLNGTITTGGSANAYTVTSSSSHTTWTNGILISAKASFSNTGAATLNLNTYGAKKIHIFVSGAEAEIAAGQIVSGGTYQFRYDTAADSASGAFILLNPTADPAVQPATGDIKIWPTDTQPSGWLWCNGAAVSRTTYATLFGIIGTTYGAGDASTTFNVPDLCGRAPFGSDDMGAISAKNRVTNAGSGIVGTTLAAAGGIESVTLSISQIPSHTHTGTTSGISADHTHTGTTTSDGNHSHTVNGTVGSLQAGNDTLGGTSPAGTGTATTNTTGAHTHTMTTGGVSADHTHTFTSAATGGGALHSNMPPALIINYVIKT